jgi:hypothetical protein
MGLMVLSLCLLVQDGFAQERANKGRTTMTVGRRGQIIKSTEDQVNQGAPN